VTLSVYFITITKSVQLKSSLRIQPFLEIKLGIQSKNLPSKAFQITTRTTVGHIIMIFGPALLVIFSCTLNCVHFVSQHLYYISVELSYLLLPPSENIKRCFRKLQTYYSSKEIILLPLITSNDCD